MGFRPERVLVQELLDSASDATARANLADIVRINRFFGGHSILRRCLRECFAAQAFTALDVGAASGDMARAAPPGARVVCADLLPRNLRAAPVPRVAADAAHLPFGDRSFDVVWCSLFLHHFPDSRAVTLLREMRRVARRFLIVIDLERHILPYHFLPLTRPLFQWHPLTVHDGVASVQAGFTAAGMSQLASQAGLDSARVRRHFPWFRISMVARLKDDRS